MGRELRKRQLPHFEAMRIRIVLRLMKDPCVSAGAEAFGIDRKTVRLWRDRYREGGREALETRCRCGGPIRIDAVSRCQVVSMACAKPKDFGVPYRPTWPLTSLAETYRARFPTLAPMSATSVFRILDGASLKPHRMRPWLHSPDPEFRPKVTEICGLYAKAPPGSVVLCIDEKTGMQALGRRHPTKPAARGRAGREEFEYKRNGTRTLFAAFDPHTGEVFGKVYARRKAVDLVRFMEHVARWVPDKEVHVVWDNLNIHYDGRDGRWTRFNERHGGRFHFHYTPIHASWVNQVEIFFSVLHRRVLRHEAYDSVGDLKTAVLGFLGHWNRREKHPFRWTFKGYPLQTGRKVA
ncbi:MAG: IS630 family transposase [Actinomycetales bacterium]|nr:IS630 family transposase [Actinomycetales bacterium]